ncbi:unnamed protein product [Toxocara canis]|uniref:Apple domain-containing protein n=2 Tax=Toxocara canis TaxID=6265 RepID=A0A183V6M5_TOXCA|nr:unnamed protein product [Toxocara canis]
MIDAAHCHFLHVHSAGFTDVFDERLQRVSDVEECERACLAWTGGVCRSFTFDKTDNACYLSHATSRSLGKNPLDITNLNLSTGDLDDCFQFRLKCKANSMQLSGSSMKIFSGTVKAKKNRDTYCEKTIKNLYPYPTFTSVIVLKEGSTDLITIRDKIIQVNCRIHQSVEVLPEQKLSFQMEIENENVTRKLVTEAIRLGASPSNFVPRPKYTLEVLDRDGQLTDTVKVGDFGFLLVTVQQQADGMESEFLVSDIAARDIKSDRMIPLLDSDGCVIERRILAFKRIDKNQLQMRIEFSGFTNQAEVVYEGIVKSCTHDCSPKCNAELWETDSEPRKATGRLNRDKRSPLTAGTSRRFEISEDIYTLRSTNKLTMIANGGTSFGVVSTALINNQEDTSQNSLVLSITKCTGVTK